MGREAQTRCAKRRWQQLFSRCGLGAPPDGDFERLAAAYAEEGRHYHTLDHVLDGLALLDGVAHLARHPEEVELALWLHDVVHDTRLDDNESASAEWAGGLLSRAGAAADVVQRVRHMILATRHADPPRTPDEALLLDIDLSILGRDPDAFGRYESQIRREYAWVPDAVFRSARTAVLAAFLERERIFHTDALHDAYESRARANLAAALQRLESCASRPDRDGPRGA